MLARALSAGRMLCRHSGKYLDSLRVLKPHKSLSGKYLAQAPTRHNVMRCVSKHIMCRGSVWKCKDSVRMCKGFFISKLCLLLTLLLTTLLSGLSRTPPPATALLINSHVGLLYIDCGSFSLPNYNT